MNRFADALLADVETLAFVATCETGRPLRRSWGDVARAAEYIRTIAAVDLPSRRFDGPGRSAVLKARPMGVVGAIAPWNAPIVLAVAKIANAEVQNSGFSADAASSSAERR